MASSLDRYNSPIQPTNKINTLPNNAFEISTEMQDGSKKYSFDTIYEDKALISRAKSYYENLYDMKYKDDKDVVDEFISDRTWKQSNIASIASEYIDIKKLDNKQRANLAYLQNYWNKLPNFYEEGGRGWAKGIFSNLWSGILDPTNLVSAGFGSIAAKTAAKKFGSGYLKDKLKDKTLTDSAKRQIQNQIDIVEKQIINQTYKFPVKKATAVATASAVGFDSSIFASADLLNQKSEMEIGVREKGKFDLKRAGQIGLIGGGISILPSGFFAYSTVREATSGLKPVTNVNVDPKLDSSKLKIFSRADKIKKPVEAAQSKRLQTTAKILGETGNKFSDTKLKYLQSLFDNRNFYKNFSEVLLGFKQTPSGLKSAFDTQVKSDFVGPLQTEKGLRDFRTDPITQSPYILSKLEATSLTRAEDALENGVLFQRLVKDEKGYERLEFIESPNGLKDGGIVKILKPYDDVGEGENFLMYILAKRQLNTWKRNDKIKDVSKQEKTIIDRDVAQRWVDYGDLTRQQYKDRYNVESGRTPGLNFKTGLEKYKKFTDDLLQAKYENGLYSAKDVKYIRQNHSDGWIPLWGQKNMDEVNDLIGSKLKTGIGDAGKRKAKIGLKRSSTNKINPLYASIIDYVTLTYRAMDINERNKAFYKLLDDADRKKIIDKTYIATPTETKATYETAVTENAVKELQKLNIKFEIDPATGKPKGLGEADKKFTATVLKNSFREKGADGKVVDVVWNNGKPTYYNINSQLMKNTFEEISHPTAFTKALGYIKYISRLPAKAITYSPPFVAFNFLRDSMTATVNSAFGFIPLFSSLKGFGLTYTGNKNGSNMKKVVNAYRRNNGFRMAQVNGLGFTTRGETEWNPNVAVAEIERYGKSSSVSWYKKNLNYLGFNYFGKGFKKYTDFIGRIEYASRLAEYNFAKKSGISSIGSAFMGREVSTDFAMKGSSKILQNYSALTMFFNAGLQGFYRGARVLREQPKKSALIIGGGIVAPEIVLWNLNHEYREYRDVPDEVKMLNYLFPFYVKDRGDGSHLHEDGTRKVEEFIAIPKPYDFGLFANIATAMLEGVYTTSPGVATQYMYHSLGIMMPGLAMPTLANPWVSMFTNTNWQGDPISPVGFSKRETRLQYKSNTRESVIQFTEFLYKITGSEGVALRGDGKMGMVISPILLDYMVNSYFTGLASYPLDILDAMIWDDENFGELPTQRGDRADLARQPWSIITRRFRVQAPIKNSKNIKTFYEIKNRADKIKNMKNLSEKDLRQVLNLSDELSIKEVQELLGISPFLSSVAGNLAKSRKARAEIKMSKFIPGTNTIYSPNLKRQHINELIQKENEMARIAILELRKSNFDTIESDIFGKTYDPKKYSTSPSSNSSGLSSQMLDLFTQN